MSYFEGSVFIKPCLAFPNYSRGWHHIFYTSLQNVHFPLLLHESVHNYCVNLWNLFSFSFYNQKLYILIGTISKMGENVMSPQPFSANRWNASLARLGYLVASFIVLFYSWIWKIGTLYYSDFHFILPCDLFVSICVSE